MSGAFGEACGTQQLPSLNRHVHCTSANLSTLLDRQTTNHDRIPSNNKRRDVARHSLSFSFRRHIVRAGEYSGKECLLWAASWSRELRFSSLAGAPAPASEPLPSASGDAAPRSLRLEIGERSRRPKAGQRCALRAQAAAWACGSWPAARSRGVATKPGELQWPRRGDGREGMKAAVYKFSEAGRHKLVRAKGLLEHRGRGALSAPTSPATGATEGIMNLVTLVKHLHFLQQLPKATCLRLPCGC